MLSFSRFYLFQCWFYFIYFSRCQQFLS
jgi:hypothetical protein